MLSKRGRGPEALAALERCHALAPRHAATLYHLGVAYCRADRFEQAIRTLETAAQLLPDNPRVLYYLGIAYDRAGRAGEGALAFRRSSELRAHGEGSGQRLD